MADATGTIAWAADYLPFGEADVTVETVDNHLRFSGQYFDQETGLHYNWNRYYDPSLGRYLRSDPIGLYGGLNLYSYTSNNPVLFVDPDGLLQGPPPVAPGIGTIIGGAIRTIIGGTLGTIGAIGGGAVIGSWPGETAGPEDDMLPPGGPGGGSDDCDQPCDPPEGTKCFEGPHTTHGHGGLGTHYDIYQMFKVRGKCGWQYLGGKVGKGVVSTPPPGVQPCSSYNGFQGRNKR